MELPNPGFDLSLHNEFSWESTDCAGGNSDDMDGGKCMVWVDTELDTELFGRKNDVMEYGDKKCWSVRLDNELSLLSDRELAAWKSEKMVAIPSPLSDRDVGFGNGFHQIILWLRKAKRENLMWLKLGGKDLQMDCTTLRAG